MSDTGDAHEVGPLGDEAAKLLGALSGWARDHAGEAGEGLSGFAAHAASAVHSIDEHVATGSAECTVCPVCRVVNAVRQLSPEVTRNLASAAASLAQAANVFMTADASAGQGTTGVEHIHLTDEWPED